MQLSHSAKYGMEGKFSSQWAVNLKSAARSAFYKTQENRHAASLGSSWALGDKTMTLFCEEILRKLRMKVSYSAHFQSEIFLGTGWRHQLHKQIVTNDLGYLHVGAGAGSGNPQNYHIVRKISLGCGTLPLDFFIDYAAETDSCSPYTFPSPRKVQAVCRAGAVQRGLCWLF